MPTPLPLRNIFDGTSTPTTSNMEAAQGNLCDFLSGLLGTTGAAVDARTALAAAASGANSDITSLSAITSINGGQLAGLRNRIINGGMQVAQRSAATLSGALQFGAVDRTQCVCYGGTGITGSVTQFVNSIWTSGYACALVNASWTNGDIQWNHRIEAKNTQDLSGKNITVSCKIVQDTGSARTFAFSLLKPTSSDNHTSTTMIRNGFGSTLVPSDGAVHLLTGTITLGVNDAVNGLQLIVYDTAASTVVNKNYYIGDLQLELGSVATTFEQRPYGMELALCQRYLPIIDSWISGQATSATSAYLVASYKVTPRVPPTGILLTASENSYAVTSPTGTSLFCNASGGLVFTASTGLSSALITATVSAGLVAGNATLFVPISNKILFTGCEL